MTQPVDKSAILNVDLIELRGPSGKLYGMLDRRSLVIEVKHKNGKPETIDLKPYLEVARHG